MTDYGKHGTGAQLPFNFQLIRVPWDAGALAEVFSVAIIPQNAFPAIAEDGSAIGGNRPDPNTGLLTLASQKLPGHLIVQFNFLMPRRSSVSRSHLGRADPRHDGGVPDERVLRTGGTRRRWSEPVTSPTPCTATTFLALLQTGIDPLGRGKPAPRAISRSFRRMRTRFRATSFRHTRS